MCVRRLTSIDLPLIQQGLLGVSPETLYRRFLGVVRAPEVDLRWVSELAGPRHVAYGACLATTGEPLGLARAVIAGERAELAVTVVDRWQGNRVGSELALALISDLRTRGVAIVFATVSLQNRRAVALFRRLGARRTGPIEGGVMEMRAALQHLPSTLRAEPDAVELDDQQASGNDSSW